MSYKTPLIADSGGSAHIAPPFPSPTFTDFPFIEEESYVICIDQMDEACAFLEENGFVVISNVLSEVELNDCVDLFAADLLAVCDKTAVQANPAFEACYNNLAKMTSLERVSQWPMTPFSQDSHHSPPGFALSGGSCAWAVRMNKQVQHVYQRLYSEKEVCSGLDRIFHHSYNQPAAKLDHEWPHVDYNRHVEDFHATPDDILLQVARTCLFV